MKKSKYKIPRALRKPSLRVGSRGRGQTSGDNVFGGSTSDTCLLDSRSVQLPFGFCSLFSVQQWVLGGGSSSRGSWRYRWSPWRKVRRVLGRNKREMSEFLGRRWPEGRRCGRKLGRNSFVFLFFAFVWSLFLISIFERGIVRASMWIGILFVLNSTKSQYYETSYAFHQTWIEVKTWNSYMESGIECLISLNDWWDTFMSVCICVYLAFVETISNYLPELSIQQGIE